MKTVFGFFTFFLLAVTVHAQLITASELSKIIKDPNVVVIDCRKSDDYLKTHIDGAINIFADDLNNNTPVEGTLKSSGDLAKIFGSKGVSNSSDIILYCKTGVNAGRVYWVLKYLGCAKVRILDGQMDGWFSARKPITKNPTKLSSKTFTPTVKSSLKVEKAYVKSKIADKKTIIVDTRKKVDFDKGHIDNAVNIDHEILIAGTKFKSIVDLTSIFNSAGVTKDKEVLLYCKTGTTASFVYFILSSMLSYPNVKVYDGAYLDWVK